MFETRLQTAERLVIEGQQRVSRQEALVARLLRDGHGRLLPDAQRLLANLCETQAELEEHLAHERVAAAR